MTKSPPIATIDDARRLIGTELGPSSWSSVSQATIDAFAEITGDHQWIHVDPDRARETATGTTIAHGLLTLSIGPALADELLSFDVQMGFNYGYERVRFPAPLPSGSRVRLWVTVTSVSAAGGGIQVGTRQRFEREGHEKPVCVADSLALVVPHGPDAS